VGAAGAGGDASSTSSDAGSSLASRLVVTRFSEQPEFQRHYKPEGKWFYSNGLQEKQVELAIKAVEQGNEPPTEEMTMEFQQELGNSHEWACAAKIETILSGANPVQVLGVGKTISRESKSSFKYTFKVVFFSKADMDKVRGSLPTIVSAVESLRRSGAQLASLRYAFYDDRQHFREDVVVHLARGAVLLDEMNSDGVIDSELGDDLMAKLVDLFSGVAGSVKEWLEGQAWASTTASLSSTAGTPYVPFRSWRRQT